MSDGLFYAMGLSDYYGYTFFFDNDGILRYEMLLDGYHSDRILSLNDQILACVGSNKIAASAASARCCRCMIWAARAASRF